MRLPLVLAASALVMLGACSSGDPAAPAGSPAAGVPSPGVAPAGSVTFHKDVAPILQTKCQSCHRPGQVGPFSLLTYDQARRWAAGIYEVVDDRRMPPWHADPRYGKFENDRSLTPRERATLVAWVEHGTPLFLGRVVDPRPS